MCLYQGQAARLGQPLITELLNRGRSVVGMTTSEAQAKNLQHQGAEAVTSKRFDARRGGCANAGGSGREIRLCGVFVPAFGLLEASAD